MAEFLVRAQPYIKMLRLNHQPGIVVAFLFGSIDASFFPLIPLIKIGIGLLAWSISIFFINDFFDKGDTDKFSFRDRILKNSHVSPQIVWVIWFLLTAISAGLLFQYHLYWQFFILLFTGNFYSIPPLRFKAYFPWDLIAISSWLVVGYSIPFTLQGIPLAQTFTIPFFVLALVLGTSEFIHFLVDIQADTKGGLHNTAVALAPNTLLRIAKVSLISAAICLCYLIWNRSNWWYYPLIPIIPYIGYALGRVREVMYKPDDGIKTLNTAYNRGVRIGNFLVVYQVIIIAYLTILAR